MLYAGELSALITAILWTGSALAFAAATIRVGSVYVNIIRLIAAVLFLFLTHIVFSINISVSNAQVWYLSLSGLAGFVFGDTFLFKSYEYISARVSSLIMAVTPAIAALFAYIFLGETITLTGFLGIAVTLGGIILVVMERKDKSSHHVPISIAGVFYSFLGAAGQAGGLIFAKSAFSIGHINGFTATMIRAVAATIILIPLNYFAKRFTNPIEVFRKDRKAFNFTILGAFLGPYIGVTFSLMAVSLTDIAVAATIMSIVPVIMLPAVWILFREKLRWRAVIGACLAVAGVGILFLR